MTTQSVAAPKTMSNETPREPGTQAIATRSSSDAVIRTPQEYRERLTLWQREHYHVLTPFAHFSSLPSHLGIVPVLVQVDADPGPRGVGDVYQDNVFTKGNDVALSKLGLAKVAQAAGMSIETFRTDPRTISNLWEVKAIATFTGIDGARQSLSATEEYDLRDGSPRLRGFTDKQIQSARAKGLRGCEARAINAAIRQFGLKQKYSREELQKPFVVLRIAVQYDMSDPVQKQIAFSNAAGSRALLYGDHVLPAAAAPEPIDVIGDSSVAAAQPAQTRRAAPPDPGQRVLSVEHDFEAGLYEITLEGGARRATRDEAVAKAAGAAKKAQQLVRLRLDAEELVAAIDIVQSAPADIEQQSSSRQPQESAGSLPSDLRHISEVKEAGRSKPGTTPVWTRYEVIATTGEIWSTFSDSIAREATEAKQRGWPVRIVDEANTKYPDQMDLKSITLVDPRQGSLLGDNV